MKIEFVIRSVVGLMIFRLALVPVWASEIVHVIVNVNVRDRGSYGGVEKVNC